MDEIILLDFNSCSVLGFCTFTRSPLLGLENSGQGDIYILLLAV